MESYISSQLTKAQQKKAVILDAALEILAEEGVTEFSLTRIQNKTGISKALIRYHYPELDTIILNLLEILAQIGQRFTLEEISKANSPLEEIHAQILASFRWAKETPNWAKFFIFVYYQSSYKEHTKLLHEKIIETGINRLEGIINRLNPKDDDNKLLALSCHNLLIGSIIRMASVDDFDNIDTYYQSCCLSYSRILNCEISALPKL